MGRSSTMSDLLKRGFRNLRRVPPYLGDKLRRTPAIARYVPCFKTALWLKGADLTPRVPETGGGPTNAALQSEAEVEDVLSRIRSLGLHPHPTVEKNWDAFHALRTILANTTPKGTILDAGGATYSPLVEWLYLYGYENLFVNNIDFDRDFTRGPIDYRQSDFTETDFDDATFDVISSLSVIEHGVPIEPMLDEFHRILKPGGRLVVSTDFWPQKRETDTIKSSYGGSTQEWNIFDIDEIETFRQTAADLGFALEGEMNCDVDETVVEWMGREFTFLLLEFRRV